MAGLVSYGVYVPRHRLRHSELGAALGVGSGEGARVVAGYDEDSTTMGVEAARRALSTGEKPGSVYFATTAPAYFDKTNASAIHAALDLGREGFAVDLAGSARCGVGALRCGLASGGLAVLSDIRTGRPGSADERHGSDGAAAFLFGCGERAIAEPVAQTSATAEFLDRWRLPGQYASRLWEERFGLEAYLPLIEDAGRRALAAAGVERTDQVVVSSPHARAAAAAAKLFGGHTPQPGFAGAADPGLKLASALDRAGPGETILLLLAADGADALVLRTTERIERAHPRTAAEVAGREISYATYLSWRGLIERETPRRPEPDPPAGPPSARSESWKFAFVGSRCTGCGRVHAPPARVCSGCHAVDRMERAPLAGRLGTVATYTVDRLAYSPSPPVIDVVVDFDGGGRCALELTDASPEQVRVGTRVELTFRRLYTTGGVHNYFWKARPISDGL